MQLYCESLTSYRRLPTREIKVGFLSIGNFHPIRVQTMTTTDTMDTRGTVLQAIRCIEAGAELVRITAPSRKEAENLLQIKNELQRLGYSTPLVADIHFTPHAAEIAARIVEKVRINPGNYIDRKKFEHIEYNDQEYQNEIDRIRQRFTPLVNICKEYGTALRIGTNHGSLSDRIMSRYGDTPMGMVESAMEFLRIAEELNYYNIVLSMKSSNPLVMVQAYRLLIQKMAEENMHYPLHLGVTEAGDGEDGRIKSSAGIGSLLEDGIGDTIRVSLTEDPELEIPVCRDLVSRYAARPVPVESRPAVVAIPYSPFRYSRRPTFPVGKIGENNVPVVIADLSRVPSIGKKEWLSLGLLNKEMRDSGNPTEITADFIYTADQLPSPELLGLNNVILNASLWMKWPEIEGCFPLFNLKEYIRSGKKSSSLNFVLLQTGTFGENEGLLVDLLLQLEKDKTAVLILESAGPEAVQAMRGVFMSLFNLKLDHPVIIRSISSGKNPAQGLIHFAVECSSLLLDGMGDGIMLSPGSGNPEFDLQATNQMAFGILQATRTRISKTDYISCPSCGRTQFELQETTSRIRDVTNHLKGVKIAIMGCIVNGPGEMADADFGYVGSGMGKITLYKGKEIMKKGLNADVAVAELVQLIRDSGMWMENKSF
ncbi:MAG TPA: (E)-4-hydroxy-3-methylbut-2-enyl-diphosphate synthase [Chitinophagaceae bacterium]|nr:(E)-4-hydroxy-3-methylbut-2-enyl-diphosphate synthase [Chitinophagaceae bacterium]